jgi:hypothetical protein
MTDEAEKAAKWDAVEQLQKVKTHLLALETQMARTGKELSAFGASLQHPKEYVFDVTSVAITLGRQGGGLGRPLGLLKPDILDWGNFSSLLNDYHAAIKEKAELTARLAEAGLPT